MPLNDNPWWRLKKKPIRIVTNFKQSLHGISPASIWLNFHSLFGMKTVHEYLATNAKRLAMRFVHHSHPAAYAAGSPTSFTRLSSKAGTTNVALNKITTLGCDCKSQDACSPTLVEFASRQMPGRRRLAVWHWLIHDPGHDSVSYTHLTLPTKRIV